jgi:hypothetical protein
VLEDQESFVGRDLIQQVPHVGPRLNEFLRLLTDPKHRLPAFLDLDQVGPQFLFLLFQAVEFLLNAGDALRPHRLEHLK